MKDFWWAMTLWKLFIQKYKIHLKRQWHRSFGSKPCFWILTFVIFVRPFLYFAIACRCKHCHLHSLSLNFFCWKISPYYSTVLNSYLFFLVFFIQKKITWRLFYFIYKENIHLNGLQEKKNYFKNYIWTFSRCFKVQTVNFYYFLFI